LIKTKSGVCNFKGVQFELPNFSEAEQANSMDDFFDSNLFYGPLSNQMAIVEFKYGRKKLYLGTLNRFIGIETMFPLVNIHNDAFTIN